MHHGAFHAQFIHGALQLIRRGLWVIDREICERRKSIRMAGNAGGEAVIGAFGQGNGGDGVDPLHGGGAVRDHLDIDAGFVHFFDTQFAQVI